jgi:hypothetical protein
MRTGQRSQQRKRNHQLFMETVMAGDSASKPGEIVKVSGIYSVVHDEGKVTLK